MVTRSSPRRVLGAIAGVPKPLISAEARAETATFAKSMYTPLRVMLLTSRLSRIPGQVIVAEPLPTVRKFSTPLSSTSDPAAASG